MRHLGFHDLRSYLESRCDTGHSVPALAREFGESEWTITQAITTLGIVLPPRPARLARQRRRHAEERIAARVAALGFTDVRAYLEDRLIAREWLLAEVAAELAADPRMVRAAAVAGRSHAPPADRPAAGRRRAGPAGAGDLLAATARRARLEALGFADLGGYLQRRYLEQEWSIKRMRAELGVGRNWLVAKMGQLGLR
jgi:AraC-like DNA-binding protein